MSQQDQEVMRTRLRVNRWILEPAFAPVMLFVTFFTSALLYVSIWTVAEPESQRLCSIAILVLFAIVAVFVVYYLVKPRVRG